MLRRRCSGESRSPRRRSSRSHDALMMGEDRSSLRHDFELIITRKLASSSFSNGSRDTGITTAVLVPRPMLLETAVIYSKSLAIEKVGRKKSSEPQHKHPIPCLNTVVNIGGFEGQRIDVSRALVRDRRLVVGCSNYRSRADGHKVRLRSGSSFESTS